MILYLAMIGDGTGSSLGVVNKIIGQANSFQKVSQFKCIIYYSKIKPNISCNENIILKSFYSKSRIYRRIKLIKSFYFYSKLYPNSKIIIRYPLTDFLFLFYLYLCRNRNVYVERQSKELPEAISNKSLPMIFLGFLDSLLYNISKKYINAEICVTDEIAHYIKKRRHDNNIFVISNGITPKYIKFETKDIISSVKLCYIGNITVWSGLDYLLMELDKISFKINKKNILLYIVGDGIYLNRIKNIYHQLKNKNNVIFCGILTGMEKEKLLLSSNIGIASLNSSKRSLSQGSNLKNREYCLYGLPFIKVDYDKDFDQIDECKDYYRNIQKKNEIIEKISELITILENKSNIRLEMNSYANKKLSWDNRINEYLNILRKETKNDF